MTTEPHTPSDSTDNAPSAPPLLPNPSMTIPHPPKKKRVDDQGPLPPDIGLKPVQLQRRRVWRACESCRRKKIKCDGVEPTCSQCSTAGSQCTWLQTKDRAALSRHYVQELEARLLRMEDIFQQVAPILEQVSQATGLDLTAISSAVSANQTQSSSSPALSIPPTISASVLQSMQPRYREDPSYSNGDSRSTSGHGETDEPAVKIEDDVSDALGQLALDEHGHLHWIGKSSTMTLIQQLRDATTAPMNRVSPMEEDPLGAGPSANKLYYPASVFFGKIRALPPPEEVEYPERDLADKLVDAYFARFHFLMPVLDKPDFLRKYRKLMDSRDKPESKRDHPAFIALMCSMFAVASRFVDDPRLKKFDNLDDGGMGMVYLERALILHYTSYPTIQVEHVQCFLLMSSFLCSVNCLPQAWQLVGQAVRAAQDIGLHRTPKWLTTLTLIEKETRRKIWWGVYTLDRMLALALGRPLAIEDADCDVEIPAPCDDEMLPQYFQGAEMPGVSLMKGFVELIELYQIAGRVLREVYALDKTKDNLEMDKRMELHRSVETLDRRLTRWCEDLPAVFKSNPTTEKQVSMAAVLCSHYYSILTTLHRNFLPVRREQPVAPRSTAKAVSTARACVRLAPSIKNVVPPSHHFAFFIQNLFSSAVIILLYAMHTTESMASQAALDEARSCLAVLESWEGFWPGARKCKELLEDLTAKASEAIRTAALNPPRGSSMASTSAASATPGTSGPPPMYSDGRSQGPSTPISVPVSERLIKNRPRRDRSRDVPLSPRNAHGPAHYRTDCECLARGVAASVLRSGRSAVAAYFATCDDDEANVCPPFSLTALRARSTSRKRPHDEDLYQDGYATMGLPSSYPGRSNLSVSAHSSPASANSHPSPPGPSHAVIDGSEQGPQSSHMMQQHQRHRQGYPPLNPTVQIPRGQQFEYEFGVPSPSDRWASPAVDANELKFFPGTHQQQQQQAAYGRQHGHTHQHSAGSFSGQLPGVDPSSPYLANFDGADFGGMTFSPVPAQANATSVGGTGTTPPSAGFAGPGLPFRGLDYIRSYDPASGGAGAGPSYVGLGEQEQYWQTLDSGAFGVDPEMAFTLGGDFTTDAAQQGQQSGQWDGGMNA
ncbi:fungal-specific transcription factor domain-containing protein [Trametes gibbosa]|uniref:Zn(2)-Cys(6)38 n=1 Tax=Trametes gibbosa TaxID=160864 RepID=A0A976XIZ9_9APHY|nr:fungal-specific transcription factor domain-containing protein [Trametes gibbosa]UVB64070.1 Zn(2)-Cys(6)38 [Trametes gibbosa]